jgi:hypothetical protein
VLQQKSPFIWLGRAVVKAVDQQGQGQSQQQMDDNQPAKLPKDSGPQNPGIRKALFDLLPQLRLKLLV